MSPPDTTLHLARLNDGTLDAFLDRLGDLYEHSPWVAAQAWTLRPFRTFRHLHDSLQSVVLAASREQQLALFRAHPELAGREAIERTLTLASSSEQSRLGIDSLGPVEFERLSALNRRYRERHGFPCIIALRQHATRDTVFAEFERRVDADREAEIAAAIVQIGFITRGRLAERFGLSTRSLT